MQSHYAESFSREMGCTLEEWRRWLPAAVGAHDWHCTTVSAHVTLEDGSLAIQWRVGEPRVIALVRMPRLYVDFVFSGVNAQQRYTFMRRFDLYMHRGGG